MTCWYSSLLHLSITDLKYTYKKKRNAQKRSHKMQKKANPSAVRLQAAQASSPSCSTRATQKSLPINKNSLEKIWRGKKSGEWDTGRKQTRRKKQQKLSRQAREETKKGNSWKRKRRQTSPASLCLSSFKKFVDLLWSKISKQTPKILDQSIP